MKILLTVLTMALLVATAATAATVRVNIIGEVEYNQVSSGDFGTIMPGDAVEIIFTVESDVFTDDPTFPVRTYPVNPGSYSITLGAVTALLNPTPTVGDPYFGVRDNDPAVDGFYFTRNAGNYPAGWQLDVFANAAQTRRFEQRFNVTYPGDRLASLDILGALGTYDYTGLSVFGFAITDLGFDPIGIIYTSMTISTPVAEETTSWGGVKALFR